MKNVIYQIVNSVTGIRYIGFAKCSKRRKYDHFSDLKKNRHINPHLQRSYNKHGQKAFQFEVIDTVPHEEELEDRENYWMDKYDFDTELYNICRYGRSRLGIPLTEEHKQKIGDAQRGEKNWNFGGTLSEETKLKISEALAGRTLSEEHAANISKALQGKSLSEETRQKISESLSGENHPGYGIPLSEEHKNKLSESNPNKVSVVQIDKNTNEILAIFCSQAEAERITGIFQRNISRACKTRFYNKQHDKWYESDIAGGYRWRYATNTDTVDEKYIGKVFTSISRKKPVAQIDKDSNEIIAIFESGCEAARKTGISQNGIHGTCNKKRGFKTAGGYKWMFVTDLEEESS